MNVSELAAAAFWPPPGAFRRITLGGGGLKLLWETNSLINNSVMARTRSRVR
jgi:hypothetical protein